MQPQWDFYKCNAPGPALRMQSTMLHSRCPLAHWVLSIPMVALQELRSKTGTAAVQLTEPSAAGKAACCNLPGASRSAH